MRYLFITHTRPYKMSLFLYLIFISMIFNYESLGANIIINRFDNNCVLATHLKEEIASYKNVTQRIMSEIIDKGLGEQMYKEYTHFIDKFGARPAGTDTLEKSINHMINLTRDFGITDVVTENVDIPHWKRGYENAAMIHPRPKNIALLGLGSSVSTPPEGITAEVLVVKNFQELDQIDEKTVKGKIVVYDVPYTNYGETVIYRSQGASKASIKGAVASLVRSIAPFSIYSPHTGAQFYAHNVTKIPTAAITHEDADLMGRLQERGEKIIVTLKMFNTFDMKVSRNTLIDLKGAESPEKLVIVSGHIDSWDVGQGAMDDGGGMMISWFAPVVLNKLNLKPKRTVRAILWTSEEPGLVGAEAYLEKHKNELSDINFIMESDEGTFKPLGLIVAGSDQARCFIAEILKLFPSIDKMSANDYPGSDINLIIREGVPGASLMNENYRYFWFHHSEGDTMNVQNKADVIQCAAFWSAVSYVIADISQDIPRS